MERVVMMHIPSGAGHIKKSQLSSTNIMYFSVGMTFVRGHSNWSEFVQPLIIPDSDTSKTGITVKLLNMWWFPPKPALVYSQPPATPNVFFHHRFFLWMPYRMLAFPFLCSQRGCEQNQFSSCRLYKTVRHLIDQVDNYYMGTEYLECRKCIRKPGFPVYRDDLKWISAGFPV
ncbi:hypothetical protein RRG08_058442 [Elysia crispata]|uniref:DUF6729 domain-containing protein n=1 Tax=Elysia crispata TaxID=231223 RepID=A0AAE1CPV7_9GAST|nr:hypothetical protein RRG08_058442 [Elysia crispata]